MEFGKKNMSKNILLVEDDSLSARTESQWLKNEGFNVFHVFDALEAIDFIKNKKGEIDLVLMDIILGGGMTGIQAAGKILDEKEIPLLFLTAHTDKELIKETEQIKSYGYILKDSTSSILIASVNNALRLFNINKELQEKETASHLNEIKQSEERFRTLLDKASNIAVQGYSPDCTVRYWNKASETLYGYSAEEAMGKSLVDLIIPFHMRNEVLEEVKNMIEKGEGNPGEELYLRKKDGTLFPVYSNHTVIDIPGRGKELYCIDIDLTERRKAEVQMRKYADELKALNSTKDKFISILAHDLRGPFQGFLGVAEYLSNDSELLSFEEIKKLSKELHLSLQKQYDLLNDLLSWTRMQSGNFFLNVRKIEIAEVIEDVIDHLMFLAKQKSIDLKVFINKEMTAYADISMFRVVIRNLVSNSIKFSNENGAIEITALNRSPFIEISVSDNGKGIAKEDMPKLFKVEARYTTEGTRKETGTGLGLVLCKEIIEKHKGTIYAESELNRGSVFRFTVPAENFI